MLPLFTIVKQKTKFTLQSRLTDYINWKLIELPKPATGAIYSWWAKRVYSFNDILEAQVVSINLKVILRLSKH